MCQPGSAAALRLAVSLSLSLLPSLPKQPKLRQTMPARLESNTRFFRTAIACAHPSGREGTFQEVRPAGLECQACSETCLPGRPRCPQHGNLAPWPCSALGFPLVSEASASAEGVRGEGERERWS